MRAAAALTACVLACGAVCAQQRTLAPSQIRSDIELLSPDMKAMQKDDFANPGMLWVEQGGKLWSTPAGASGKSCASCHGDASASMKGVAARYPLVDKTSGRLMTLDRRVQECRAERQRADPPAYESQELLALTTFVAHQSRGMPVDVSIDGPAKKYFDAGQALFHRRLGQMNLSCAQCHDQNWDRRLYAGLITQGQPNGFPIYRLEWQTLGSLERRLRACLSGIRAEMFPYGSDEHAELALFLAWRAKGLPIETPAVRR